MGEPAEIQTDLSVTAEISLYYDLYVPDGLGRDVPLLIAVHGYGAHKRQMMREARLVGGDRYVIASIQAPHPHFRKTDTGYRTGYGWLTDERPEEHVRLHHKFVLEVIERLVVDHSVDRQKVFLYGFSQACALNFRLVFTHPEAAAGLIGVCGGIPGDLDINPAYGGYQGSVLYLYGDNDEFYSADQFAAYDDALSEHLTHYTSRRFAAKHEITEPMRDEIRAFLDGSHLQPIK